MKQKLFSFLIIIISFITINSKLLFPYGGQVYYYNMPNKEENQGFYKAMDKASMRIKNHDVGEARALLQNIIKKNSNHKYLYHFLIKLGDTYRYDKNKALIEYNKAITWIKQNKSGNIEDIYIKMAYLENPRLEDRWLDDNMISYLKKALKENPDLKKKYLIYAKLGDCYYKKIYTQGRERGDTGIFLRN